MKRFFESLTCDKLNKTVAVVLAVFFLVGGLLYWQGEMGILGFGFFALFSLVIGGLLVFDSRLAQKDGFLDGYVRAKNDFNRKKQE